LETGSGTGTTKAELQLANPHGDVVATIDVTTGVEAAAMSSVADYDEYGIVVTATAPSPYGWVGTATRASANQGGLIQMGARMYNPATGRFLTTDPVPGGTPNPYTYPPDPVNMYDLAGTWSIGGVIQNIVNTVRKAVQWVANKATAGFSAVVRAATYGRININIPKIKIPKFKMPKIKMPNIGGGGGNIAMISLPDTLTGPMKMPSFLAVSASFCGLVCFQVNFTSEGGLTSQAQPHGSAQVGCCGMFGGVSGGSNFGSDPQVGDVALQVGGGAFGKFGGSVNGGSVNGNGGVGGGWYAGPMWTFGVW